MTKKRRREIVDYLRENGEGRVDDLASKFGVSEVTIRNDLTALADQGLIIRDHGGAMPASSIHSLTDFEQRSRHNTSEKQKIGQKAAELIVPGDTILIDAGTTAIEMVPFLEKANPSLVVTNALNVAHEIATKTSIDLIVIGGNFNRTAFSTVGMFASSVLKELSIDKLFLGTQAFNIERGLTDTTVEIAQVKRAMMAAANQTIILTDSTKWNKTGIVQVAPLSAVTSIVVDAGLPAAARSAILSLTDLKIVN